MGVGYATYTDTLTIAGTANAKYKIYEITYILNGGKNPENVVNSFRIVDDIPLPIPSKTDYKFSGWYDNESCVGQRLLTTNDLKSDVVLYAKWEKSTFIKEEYSFDGEYIFTGNNYIDTNVYLYSKENIHKNFLISFDIVKVDEGNINHNALMNSMNESGSPWSGHVVKYSDNGTIKSVKFESNSNTSSTGDVYVSSNVKNIRIFRINDKLYYSFDGKNCVKINDYTGFTGTFDIPVTFGASLNGQKEPFRYFKGTLSNMSVSFLDDGVSIEDFNTTSEELKVMYAFNGEYTFDGKSTYIDTGLYLFNEENINKNFEISFNIDYVGEQNGTQTTIINTKNETIKTYPGFVYRLYQHHDDTIRFEAKGGTGGGASNKIVDVQRVKISRIDSKIYLSINGAESKQVYDYTNFKNYFSIPLTIGASLDSKGEPFRYFNGILSNIIVKVQE